MQPIPIYDDSVPVACTLSREEIPERIELIERMRHNLTSIEPTTHGLLLHFPNHPDIDADLRRFTVDEKRCCQFWGFEVEPVDHQLTLRWEGPPDAQGHLAQLLAYFEGDAPLTLISGLL